MEKQTIEFSDIDLPLPHPPRRATISVRESIPTLGLDHLSLVYRDTHFLLALLAGGLFWITLWFRGWAGPIALKEVFSWHYIVLVLLWPCLEEFFFRGMVQAHLFQQPWGKKERHGITMANVTTSLFFTLGHFGLHPPHWAMMVFVPSLIFGYFRDRSMSIYPSIMLHTFYNAGFFSLVGLPSF